MNQYRQVAMVIKLGTFFRLHPSTRVIPAIDCAGWHPVGRFGHHWRIENYWHHVCRQCQPVLVH